MNPALLAALSGGIKTASAATGNILDRILSKERSDIRESKRSLLESEREVGETPTDVNLRRLIAGGAGLLLGGVPGAFLGSLVGQTTAKGTRKPKVSYDSKPGMFYSGAREAISDRAEDVNRFIEKANESFAATALVRSAQDAFTANQVLKAFPGLNASPEFISGKIRKVLGTGKEAPFTFKDMINFKDKPTSLLEIPGLEKINERNFTKYTDLLDVFGGKPNSMFPDTLKLPSPRTAIYGTQGDFSGNLEDLIRSLR
jgi:hypothetical protein|tara:strand:+ start:350 stop:1123 length:774 start_codon:yes stop_codon:yes gene_type:complete